MPMARGCAGWPCPGRVAGAALGGVLGEGDVAEVVQRLDVPVAAPAVREGAGWAWAAVRLVTADTVTVSAPKDGPLRLVVTRTRHGNLEPVVTSDLGADLNRVVEGKHSRWSVETSFRDTKQDTGLGACQCDPDAAMVRHVGLVLVGFVVLHHLRTIPAKASPPSRNDGS